MHKHILKRQNVCRCVAVRIFVCVQKMRKSAFTLHITISTRRFGGVYGKNPHRWAVHANKLTAFEVRRRAEKYDFVEKRM